MFVLISPCGDNFYEICCILIVNVAHQSNSCTLIICQIFAVFSSKFALNSGLIQRRVFHIMKVKDQGHWA